MAKKKRNKIILFSILILGLMAVIIGGTSYFSTTQGQSFSLTEGQYFLPVFGNIACEKTDRPTNDLVFEPFTTTSGIFFTDEKFSIDVSNENGDLIETQNDRLEIFCSAEYDNIYTNECVIEAKAKSGFASTEYLCPANYRDLDECEDITPNVGFASNTWIKIATIDRDEAVVVTDFENTALTSDDVVKGDMQYRSIRDEYGLISLNSGRKEKFNSCDLRDITRTTADVLNKDINVAETEGKLVGTTLLFGQTINYVTDFQAVSDSKRIIENNEFYSYGGGIKFPIVQAQSGRQFVDLTKKVSDSNIICDPAQLFCIDDGKTIDVQFGLQDECQFEGEVIGWLPSSEKNNFVEQRQCADGKFKIINSKPIPTCTESETLNDEYVCVKGTVRDVASVGGEGEDKSFTAIIIGIIGAIAIVVASAQLKRKD